MIRYILIILLTIAIGCQKSGDNIVEVIPLAPTELKAFLITNDQIKLEWKDNSTNETGYKILTPFESKKVRNFCSKRSFIITNSTQEDHVVRVEIPHMNKCEFIPLKKTPLVFSYNKTIEFKRDIEGEYMAKFDLLRLRLNNMLVPEEDTLEQDDDIDTVSINGSVYEDVEDIYYDFKKCRVVPADFIDVSIPYKNDAELLDFWNSGGYKRCYEIYDRFIGTNLMIPNVNECIRDLSNMLHVYTNSHMKTEKRQKRLDMFKQLDENRKKQWELEQTGTTNHI
jgi:hypothetical protein